MNTENKWVVALGNPFDGVSLFGPFNTQDEARAYGEEFAGNDWWFVEVNKPEPEVL